MKPFLSLLTLALLSSCASTVQPADPQLPSTLTLFQGMSQYNTRPESETVLQGVLSFTTNPTPSPSEPSTRYIFRTPGASYFLIDPAGSEAALRGFLSKTVYVRGKIIDIHVNDATWPHAVLPAVISVDAQQL